MRVGSPFSVECLFLKIIYHVPGSVFSKNAELVMIFGSGYVDSSLTKISGSLWEN